MDPVKSDLGETWSLGPPIDTLMILITLVLPKIIFQTLLNQKKYFRVFKSVFILSMVSFAKTKARFII